ncbi:hypothetical protein BCR42DRAFT_478543 [Absidia repens]|uniref:Carrier domain-containing protein n=1 Tax=Absidia repens TaxID=90262 RepID=A0A1X2IK25_9FUNG|nr:hypothetical protein BCR42DRAFT_478543 [Absidia repens]
MLRPTSLLNAASKATFYRSTLPAWRSFYSANTTDKKNELPQADIEARVLKVFKESLHDKQNFSRCQLNEDIGLETLKSEDICVRLEREFNVNIPLVDAEWFNTPRNYSEYISEKEDAK